MSAGWHQLQVDKLDGARVSEQVKSQSKGKLRDQGINAPLTYLSVVTLYKNDAFTELAYENKLRRLINVPTHLTLIQRFSPESESVSITDSISLLALIIINRSTSVSLSALVTK